MNSNEDIHDSGSVQKKSSSSTGSDQPVVKRPRIETPSPLPTFKVRHDNKHDSIKLFFFEFFLNFFLFFRLLKREGQEFNAFVINFRSGKRSWGTESLRSSNWFRLSER